VTTNAPAPQVRRLASAVDDVRSAVASADPSECPDAVVRALDAVYDLWEWWRRSASLSSHQADDRVALDQDEGGRITAALVHARGDKTHHHVEFGEFTDTIAMHYYDHYGCWRWQDRPEETKAQYERRANWYVQYVAHREVLPPFERALAWFLGQSELVSHPAGS
jgi:hypothetical protein